MSNPCEECCFFKPTKMQPKKKIVDRYEIPEFEYRLTKKAKKKTFSMNPMILVINFIAILKLIDFKSFM